MFKRSLSCKTSNEDAKRIKLEASASSSSVFSVHRESWGKSEGDEDDWGEDPDDEFLCLVSQACEKAETHETDVVTKPQFRLTKNQTTRDDSQRSTFPLPLASHGADGSGPSTSRAQTVGIKHEKCTMSNNFSISDMATNEHMQHLLKQFKTIKTENESLKCKNNVLVDECLTKDGETSILRVQLKNCQAQINMVKVEKLKYQEKSQTEFNNKLRQIADELDNFKSQLEFKNLEVNSLKEKCKILESSKIKFVEPSLSTTDNFKWSNLSQRINSTSSKIEPTCKKSVSIGENSTQTEFNISDIDFELKSTLSNPIMNDIDKSIFNNSQANEIPILFRSSRVSDYIEHSNFTIMSKKMLNSINRNKNKRKKDSQPILKIDCIYKDLYELMQYTSENLSNDASLISAVRIVFVTEEFLNRTLKQLDSMTQNISVLTLRESDKQYFDIMRENCDLMLDKNLFDDRPWFENEQSIDTRRLLSVLAVLCNHIKPLAEFINDSTKLLSKYSIVIEDLKKNLKSRDYIIEERSDYFFTLLSKICDIIAEIGCSHFYTGVLSSVCYFFDMFIMDVSNNSAYLKVYDIIEKMLLLRPHIRILENLMKVLYPICKDEIVAKRLCRNTESGHLKLDYKEGVAVYSIDTCPLQLLCNNIEVWTSYITEMEHMEIIFSITFCFMRLHRWGTHHKTTWAVYDPTNKCYCSIKLNRCLCICLHKCALLYKQYTDCLSSNNLRKNFNSIIRAGIMLLSFCILKDVEFTSRLGDCEGYYQLFVNICDNVKEQLEFHEINRNALQDLLDSIYCVSDNIEEPSEEAKNVWERSFQSLFIND